MLSLCFWPPPVHKLAAPTAEHTAHTAPQLAHHTGVFGRVATIVNHGMSCVQVIDMVPIY